MSSYGKELQDRILQARQWGEKYTKIMNLLQQSIGTCVGTGTNIGDRDVDYCLTTDGLVRFRDRIYVLNCSEVKKLILREFHVKPYSSHLRYQKMLMMVKKFYYWPNLKKELAKFVARCLDCQ